VAPLSQKQIEDIYEKWAKAEKGLNLAIVRTETQDLIGHADCDWGWDPHSPSLSLVIAPAHQRRGYGSAVLGLLLRYLFDYTPAHHVACWIADWNQPALELMARHGFRQAGRMRRAGIRQGQYYDVIITELLRPDYRQLGGESHAA
jgi:ribosomal-protein-alanine N-acetyltransferase